MAELAEVYGWSTSQTGELWFDELSWWVERSRRDRASRGLRIWNATHGSEKYAKELERQANGVKEVGGDMASGLMELASFTGDDKMVQKVEQRRQALEVLRSSRVDH